MAIIHQFLNLFLIFSCSISVDSQFIKVGLEPATTRTTIDEIDDAVDAIEYVSSIFVDEIFKIALGTRNTTKNSNNRIVAPVRGRTTTNGPDLGKKLREVDALFQARQRRNV